MIKVLLVEDNKIPQKMAIMILSALDCDIDIAETGLQSLELLKKNDYDVVFLDLGLPDISGIEVAKTYRNTEPKGHHLLIVALTAHGDQSNKEACINARIDDFIEKPLHNETAKEIIEKIATSKQR